MRPELLQKLSGLTDAQRNYVLTAQLRFKETGIAYILWFILGVHYFYINKPVVNIIYWLTIGGLGIWAIIDIFRIPGLVRRRNEELMDEAIKEAMVLFPAAEV